MPVVESGKGIFASIFGFITNSFGFIMLFILGLTVFRNRRSLTGSSATPVQSATPVTSSEMV